LKEEITNQLQAHYTSDSYRFEVSIKWIPPNIQEKKRNEISQVSFQGVGLPRDYVIYNVKYLDHGTKRNTHIQVYVQAKQKLPVALHRLNSGHKINANDLTDHWLDITKDKDRYIADSGKLTGFVLKHIVNKGRPFHRRDVRQVPIIHQGDEVTLFYYQKGISITLNCVARQPGAVGEEIRLFNRDTGKMYLGEVKGKTQVIWKKTL